MALTLDEVLLNILDADPATPAAGDLWCSTPNGLGPKATQAASGFMCKEDKLKLDNMSANGSGDDWCSGLLVTAHSPNNQTVDYTSGTYMINGTMYSIASGGTYNLASGFGGVNHYSALSSGQRAIVLIYADSAQVIKSVAGPSTSSCHPVRPDIPVDTVALAFVQISKSSGGSSRAITPYNVTDARQARQPLNDELVKISATDTTSGFLGDKLTNNGSVRFTKENADANETLKADILATEVDSDATTTTTSTSDVLMSGMTVTPEAGTYLVFFTGSIQHSSGAVTTISIYAGGSYVMRRTVNSSNATNRMGFSCVAKVTVNGSQAIEGKWKTASGTATAYERGLHTLKVT